MHSTPARSVIPSTAETEVGALGYHREEATPHPGLILDALVWCEVMAAGELTLSAYEVRLQEGCEE